MKKRYITLIVLAIIIVAMFGIRYYNFNIRDNGDVTEEAVTESGVTESTTEEYTITDSTEEQVGSSDVEVYTPSVGLHTDTETSSNRVEVDEDLDTSDIIQTTPNYPAVTKIWSKEDVPEIFRTYGETAVVSSFDTSMATALTDTDMTSTKLYLVGENQNNADLVNGTMYSLSWLISNINSLSTSNAVKFTDLKVVTTLSDNAVLCAYSFSDGYDTNTNLVCLVDNSGTLNMSDYYAGAVFSTVVYAHNIYVTNVGMDTVVTIYFDTFKS